MDNEGHNLHIPVRMSAWGLFQKSTLVSFLLKFQAYKEIHTKNGIKNISKFNLQIRIKNWAPDPISDPTIFTETKIPKPRLGCTKSSFITRRKPNCPGPLWYSAKLKWKRDFNQFLFLNQRCCGGTMYRKWPTWSKANITFSTWHRISKFKSRNQGNCGGRSP